MKVPRAELRHCILRARLMDQLSREGVQVALPTSLSGIDLLAYTAPLNNNAPISTVPIKMMCMAYDTFLRDFARLRTAGLLVLLLEDAGEHVNTFALAAPELTLVQMVGLIDAKDDPRDDCSQASVLRRVLQPYAMTSGGWRSKISRWIRERQSSSAGFESHKRALS
jgi:hypothetical protein